ncbi:MAG: alpha-ketoglutarate-dependent 2,4-dichlorophenoxyacetate dioxygenase [Alphaproteobacteria bacterium]|nr:alpha-ketoglutarate-dependent 2,4-dichlorophenoxyacetate dioxygenase [Alphaproteobacteria bacterium]
MAITVAPITETFAAEIGDIDLSRPLSAEDAEAVKQAFWTYSVLIFPEQKLEAEQHLEFARLFGPLESSIMLYGDAPVRTRPEIADVSNLNHKSEIWGKESRLRLFQLGNRLWHTDSSFKRLPALCSLLYARSIPPVGGHTEFADQRAGYDALPEAMKRKLEGLVAEHCIAYSRARLGFTQLNDAEKTNLPPVPQMLVRTIPQNGRKSLYVAAHAGRIRGMEDEAGKALIDELIAHATQRQFVYTHRWRVGDLVMWDNRCTMHRGKDFDDLRYRRDMQRATVSDIANTCEQAGVAVAAE